jgi:hypothetical protein
MKLQEKCVVVTGANGLTRDALPSLMIQSITGASFTVVSVPIHVVKCPVRCCLVELAFPSPLFVLLAREPTVDC